MITIHFIIVCVLCSYIDIHYNISHKFMKILQATWCDRTIFVWKSIGLVLKYGTLPSLRSLVDGSVP
uniref:Uncharacterized protein n=1 Tax=Populus trichocarpa TaxID=3694 RepID=U5GGM3_POPTR